MESSLAVIAASSRVNHKFTNPLVGITNDDDHASFSYHCYCLTSSFYDHDGPYWDLRTIFNLVPSSFAIVEASSISYMVLGPTFGRYNHIKEEGIVPLIIFLLKINLIRSNFIPFK